MAKVNGGRQYLRLRGRTWYFQRAVPLDLQARVGHKTFERSLETSDLKEAQRKRWLVLAEVDLMVERLRADKRITTEEIKAERDREFARLYSELRDLKTRHGHERVDHDFQIWRDHHSVETETGPEPAASEDDLREAEGIMRRIGARITEEDAATLAQRIVEARFDAYGAVLSGQVVEVPSHTSPTRRHGRLGDLRVSEAAERYLVEAEAGDMTAQTIYMARQSLGLLALFTENAPLGDITVAKARDFAAALARLKPRGASGADLPARFEDLAIGPPFLAGATINHHLMACRGLWRWGERAGYLDEEKVSPFSNVRAKVERESRTRYLPFTPAEVERLLAALPVATESDRPDGKTALPWLLRIGLYAGLRLDEACGLRVTDIRKDDGGFFFAVEEHDQRKLKSEAAVRRVPVHSALIEAGLLDYRDHVVAAGHAALFPNLRPGPVSGRLSHYVSKHFTRARKAAGVTRDRVVFHSTRKSFTAALQEAGVPEVEAAVLLGHKIATMTYGLYGGGLSLPRLREHVERVKYSADFRRSAATASQDRPAEVRR